MDVGLSGNAYYPGELSGKPKEPSEQQSRGARKVVPRRAGQVHWSGCGKTCADANELTLECVLSFDAKIPLWHPPWLHTGAALALGKYPAAAAATGWGTRQSASAATLRVRGEQ